MLLCLSMAAVYFNIRVRRRNVAIVTLDRAEDLPGFGQVVLKNQDSNDVRSRQFHSFVLF